MSKALRWIVPAAALAIVIALAALLYPRLAVHYAPETEPEQPRETAAAAAATDPAVSDEPEQAEPAAPDFTVTDIHGEPFTLSEHRGRPVVVNFWAMWCPPCRSELPAFESLCAEYGDRIDFMMVNLTDGQRDTEDIVRSFIAEQGYTFPVYYDKEFSAANAYEIYSIPVTVFIRPDGTIANQQIGAMQEHVLRAYLEDLLAE